MFLIENLKEREFLAELVRQTCRELKKTAPANLKTVIRHPAKRAGTQ